MSNYEFQSISLDRHVIAYSRKRGPGRQREEGPFWVGNCQAWVHTVLRWRFGVVLPATMRSKELFEDECQYVQSVVAGQDVFVPGDIFLFGRANLSDLRLLHCAIFTGLYTRQTGEPILEHANIVDKTLGFWPLSQFSTVPRYEVLYAVKRPIKLI